MKLHLPMSLIAAVLSLGMAGEALAGWGRVRPYVAPSAPVVVTNHVVVPSTTYYAPATTYYAPTTTYYTPVPTVVARPVVAPAAVATPGYVIPPPAFRLRRAAPSLYVAPTYVVP